jgi:WhiB family redox-sensing transcriptional regulator
LAQKYERLVPDFLTDETPACAEVDPDAFFPMEIELHGQLVPSSKYENESGAKKICSDCTYKLECLIFAIKTNEIGIWGGTNEFERKQLRKRKNLDFYIK